MIDLPLLVDVAEDDWNGELVQLTQGSVEDDDEL